MVELLLNQGAEVRRNPFDMQGTSLHFAAKYGHTEVVEMLISRYRQTLNLPRLPVASDPDTMSPNERTFSSFINDWASQHTPLMYAVYARDKVGLFPSPLPPLLPPAFVHFVCSLFNSKQYLPNRHQWNCC